MFKLSGSNLECLGFNVLFKGVNMIFKIFLIIQGQFFSCLHVLERLLCQRIQSWLFYIANTWLAVHQKVQGGNPEAKCAHIHKQRAKRERKRITNRFFALFRRQNHFRRLEDSRTLSTSFFLLPIWAVTYSNSRTRNRPLHFPFSDSKQSYIYMHYIRQSCLIIYIEQQDNRVSSRDLVGFFSLLHSIHKVSCSNICNIEQSGSLKYISN